MRNRTGRRRPVACVWRVLGGRARGQRRGVGAGCGCGVGHGDFELDGVGDAESLASEHAGNEFFTAGVVAAEQLETQAGTKAFTVNTTNASTATTDWNPDLTAENVGEGVPPVPCIAPGTTGSRAGG